MSEPQCVTLPDGSKEWRVKGLLHRNDGPAVEKADGSQAWYFNGKLHREDGPAVAWADGTKFWFHNGRFHREDGPAIEYSDGSEEYWEHDRRIIKNDPGLAERRTEEAFAGASCQPVTNVCTLILYSRHSLCPLVNPACLPLTSSAPSGRGS